MKIQLQKKAYTFLIFFLLLSSSIEGQDYAKMVDTKIGTVGNGLGCGFNYIGASYPFGMVQFTPSFFSPNKGFVINQLSGAGCPHMGNFPVFPIAGKLEKSPDAMDKYSPYKKINNAHAGYLSVQMEDDTQANVTVNKRSGIANFKFDQSKQNGTVLIGSGISSTFVHNAMVKITSNSTCEGFADGGEFCGTKTKYRVYFAAEFNTPSASLGTWTKTALLKNEKTAFGENSGAYFTFDTSVNKEVNYQIAISYVSIENAKANLKASKAYDNFYEYRSHAENEWNKSLGKIAIKTSNQDRKIQFYTHLYHSLIHPNIVSDVNGDYMGSDFQAYNDKDREHYSSFSVWDTYRTQAQLVAMLYPKKSSDMMQSLVDFAEQSGGYGRWILANIETGIMQGDPTPILISSSYAFGAKDFDLEKSYTYMKRGANEPLLLSQDQEIRPHLTEYLRDGHTFASMALEYTSADFAIGKFAENALQKSTDAKYFTKRAQNWKNLYNPNNNWLNSRFPNGKWKDITHDWREATYKNYFWMVPYNLEKLIDTIGGKKVAEKRLDTLFKRLDASYEEDWFAAGNEPDFQVPWVYNWTGKPYKTSEVIHRIFNEIYNSTPSGLPGNDDLGSMGAWYVFASIGLYPMIPGEGGFSINTPQFEEVNIRLPKGNLVISGGGNNKIYIQSLRLNGKPYKNTWLDWNIIEKGGKMEFKTSSRINKKWGTTITPPNYNN